VTSAGSLRRIAAAVAKKYPDVTAEQLKASVREAAKGGKSDSEIAHALRAKYKGAAFEDLLAGVGEAALKGAQHDQLLKAIRQSTPTSHKPGPR
jgi:alkylhydroperoxidase/carboxymuconolactone decarboxylase family protein YurZ